MLPLDDTAVWRRDAGARSLSWYALTGTPTVTAALIDDLETRARATGMNARACLHQGPDAGLHEMVIVQHRDRAFPPKRHPRKSKSFVILRGELAVFTFSDDGEQVQRHLLAAGGTLACRIDAGLYHMDLPVSPLAVHLETTPGPFTGEADRRLAPWGFDVADQQGRALFVKALAARLGERR